MTGRVLAGRFELLAREAEGSFGEVWSALDRSTRRPVVVKFMATGAQAVDAWRHEWAALQALRVPGVVEGLDRGEDEGRTWIALERVDGAPFPGAGPLVTERVVERLDALLAVLARLHAAGFAHGDLKPDHVRVEVGGAVRLLDFGSARRLDEAGWAPGTARWMAPERLDGGPPTVAADLFAVGVLAWEALAQLPLWPTWTPGRTRAPAARLLEVRPGLPPELGALVDQLVALDPSSRPRGVAETLHRLRIIRSGSVAPFLPWLGGPEPIDRVVEGLRSGRRVAVHGAPGSGRTRLLAEVASRLVAGGARVARVPPGRYPFESLTSVLGPLGVSRETALERARASIQARLVEVLDAGVVLLVDDPERVDRWTSALLDELDGTRRVATLVPEPHPGAVVLRPLTQVALRELFSGAERLWHLVTAPADELYLRTGGRPALVADELAAWLDARIVERRGDHFEMHPEGLVRLDASAGRRLGGLAIRYDRRRLPDVSTDLLGWIGLAVTPMRTETLVSATSRPRWEVEAMLDPLLEAGLVDRLGDARLRDRSGGAGFAGWTTEKRAEVSARLAPLLPAASVGRMVAWLLGGRPDRAVDEALEGAQQLAATGTVVRSVAILEPLVHLARDAGWAERESRLLEELVLATLAARNDRFLRLVEGLLAGALDPIRVQPLRALVDTAAAVLGGEPARATSTLARVPAFDGEELDGWRFSFAATAAARGGGGREADVVEEAELWAAARGTPSARALAAAIRRGYHYGRGEFPEAAAAARVAADHLPRLEARLAARAILASILLELGRLVEARAEAREVYTDARAVRHTVLQARAEWLLRSIGYRTDGTYEPDLDLVEAVGLLGLPWLEGVVALNEAAVAWRLGDFDTAGPLARSAASRCRDGAFYEPVVLAEALAAACGHAEGLDPGRLVSNAVSARHAEVGWQALGLLAAAWPGVDVAAAAARLRGRLRGPRQTRQEVCSIEEAEQMIRDRALPGLVPSRGGP